MLSPEFEPLPSLDLITQATQAQELARSEAVEEEANSKKTDQMVFASMAESTTAVDQRTAVQDLTSPTPTPTPNESPTPTSHTKPDTKPDTKSNA